MKKIKNILNKNITLIGCILFIKTLKRYKFDWAECNNFTLKKLNQRIGEKQFLFIGKLNNQYIIEFELKLVDVFLFSDNLGVFIMKTKLPQKHLPR